MGIEIQLWHAKDPTFSVPQFVPDNLNGDWVHLCDFTNVPGTEMEALEAVFLRTQNVEEPWGTGEDRSTSVGDIMVITNGWDIGLKVFVVDRFGFREFESGRSH